MAFKGDKGEISLYIVKPCVYVYIHIYALLNHKHSCSCSCGTGLVAIPSPHVHCLWTPANGGHSEILHFGPYPRCQDCGGKQDS
jgi:hypothetical protein